MLLPRHTHVDEGGGEDPRAELVRRLVEYEQMKLAAQSLNEHPQAERDFQWVEVWVEKSLAQRLPEVSTADLQSAWQRILGQARLHKHHRVQREELSVREHMGMILRQLQLEHAAGVDFVEFDALFSPDMGVSSLVVHFLAMLELARERLIGLAQTEPFAPIYLKLGGEPGQPPTEDGDNVLVTE
jgi:segregation and condensation protein A